MESVEGAHTSAASPESYPGSPPWTWVSPPDQSLAGPDEGNKQTVASPHGRWTPSAWKRESLVPHSHATVVSLNAPEEHYDSHQCIRGYAWDPVGAWGFSDQRLGDFHNRFPVDHCGPDCNSPGTEHWHSEAHRRKLQAACCAGDEAGLGDRTNCPCEG